MKAPARLRLFAITWPIFVENLLMVLMGLFGLWLTSRISTGAVATYGLVNQVFGALQIVFRVVSIGTSVVVTQHHGAGDENGAHAVAKTGLAASLWLGIACFVFLLLCAGGLLFVLHLPAELMPLGTPYMRWLGLALLFDAVSMTMIAVLRAYTHTRESMKIVLAMNFVQVALSVPLMLGFGGWQGWGLDGLAIAMALSRVFAIGLAWHVWRHRLLVHVRVPEWLRLERVPLASILRIGLPGAGEKVAFRVSFMISMAMVASFGQVALATHAYVWQAVQLVTLFTNSVGFGTEIVVGHHIGAGHLHRANRVLWRATAWGFGIMLACALASYCLTPLAVSRAGADSVVLQLVGLIVLIELVLEPGRSFNIVVTSGLRAAGDARFPVKISMISVFLFGVGLAWLLGVHWGMGLVGVWIGYAADECCRGLIMLWRWWSLGWVRHARSARRHILAHMQI
jgi:putative MATE family efflux protein